MADRLRAAGVLLAAAAALASCSAARESTGPSPSPSHRPPHTAAAHRAAVNRAAAHAAESVGAELITRTIPGTASHFQARPAEIWLPPALRTDSTLRLPVLELLHGTPGGPTDWPVKGRVVAILDAFAAAHHGRAPIVVMPDLNGSHRGDTECITTPSGANVERYLNVDVPRWVRAHYRTRLDRRWAVAGLSEGGTCALMLALRHGSTYGLFGDFSGLGRPTVGDHDDAAATIRELFHGSRTAYDQHDPLWLMRHHRYPQLAGWIEYGTSDAAVAKASKQVAADARAAGVRVRELAVPGRHAWPVWHSALLTMLPWIWRLLG